MKSKDEIYQKIKNNIKSSITEAWDEAVLKINVAPNFSSYKGYYLKSGIEKPIKVSMFDPSLDNDLIELNLITTNTEKEIEKWNIAYFTLFKNGNFKIEYLWDQGLDDSVYS